MHGYKFVVNYSGKETHKTILGGVASIFKVGMIVVAFYVHFIQMINYGKTYILQFETTTEFVNHGEVSMDDMGTPYYTLNYKNEHLNQTDNELCSETNGNCLEMVQKSIKNV